MEGEGGEMTKEQLAVVERYREQQAAIDCTIMVSSQLFVVSTGKKMSKIG